METARIVLALFGGFVVSLALPILLTGAGHGFYAPLLSFPGLALIPLSEVGEFRSSRRRQSAILAGALVLDLSILVALCLEFRSDYYWATTFFSAGFIPWFAIWLVLWLGWQIRLAMAVRAGAAVA